MGGGGCRAIVGEPAPRFNCKAIIDGRIKDYDSRNVMQDKQWLILMFFPMAWSFICPGEITAFSARYSEFSQRGCAVLFISTDSEHVLRAWNNVPIDEGGLGNISMPLLSDRSHRISKDYGVLIEEEGIAQRAVFIIDPTGIIRSTSVNDANVGRSVDEIGRLLDALKFSDEHGQGCPVDWRAGQRGITMSLPDAPDITIPLTPGPTWQAEPQSQSQSPPQPQSRPHAGSQSNTQRTPAQTPPTTPPAMNFSRPPLSRGVSWSSAPWGKNNNGRPYSASGSPKLPSTPTEKKGRPMSLFWAGGAWDGGALASMEEGGT